MTVKSKVLYKFRTFNENGFKLLINKELYFARPKQLNDPLDYQIPIKRILLQAITEETDIHLKKNLEFFNDHFVIPKVDGRKISQYDYMQKVLNNSGILSLSKNNRDPLLWSHYAGGHTGFCVGFDSRKLNSFLNKKNISMYEISYLKGLPYKVLFKEMAKEFLEIKKDITKTTTKAEITERINTIFNCFNKNLIKNLFTTKSIDWEYEGECRFVKGVSGLVKFEPEILQEIIFGLKAHKKNRQTIKNLLDNSQWGHVKFNEVQPSLSSFGFKIIPFN